MASADTAKMIVELDFKSGKFTAGISSAQRSLGQFEKRVGKLGSIAARGMSQAGKNIERGIALGAAAAAGAMVYAVNAAIDWESAMAGVNKTIEATPVELKAIEQGLIGISNKTGAAATDLAAIAENAGALGIAKGDILAFTETVAMIGATTNVTTEEASTALGQLGNVLRLTGDDYDNFAATLVDLGNKGASTEAQILEIARRTGSAAALFGLAKDETLAWSSAAANLGMNEELAGTALQKMFLVAMPQFTNATENIMRVTGMTGKALKQAYEKDAGGAMSMLIKKIGELPKAERQSAAAEIFGKTSGLTRLILGLADSYDRNLSPALKTGEEAWKANTAAAEEFAKRQATTQSQINRLQANIKNAAVTIGTNLLPMINELATEATGWISSHQPEIKQFGKDLAAGIKEAVKWAKSLDWNAIMFALKAGAGFAKGLIQAFLMAPPWLQAFLAGGFVANKFTGGMVTGLAVEIGKIALGGIFDRGTPINPMWTKEVGLPGLPGGGTPAIPAVGGGSLLATLGAIGITAASIAAAGWAFFKVTEATWGGGTKGREVTVATNKNPADVNTAVWRTIVDDLGIGQPKTTPQGSGRGDTSTAREVKRLADQQALAARIVAAGGQATAARMAAIMEKNARTSASGDDRIAGNIDRLNATVATGAGLVDASVKNLVPTINAATGFRTNPRPTVDMERAGIIARIKAKTGVTPDAARVTAVLEKNRRSAESGDDRIARRLAGLATATKNGLDKTASAASAAAAAIRDKNFSPVVQVAAPVVNVSTGFTISVRNAQVTTKKYTSYNIGKRTPTTFEDQH